MSNYILDLKDVTDKARTALQELLDAANLSAGKIVVLGCSTSEITGQKIGSASNLEIAEAIMDGILPLLQEKRLYLAVQACEHLNRSLVVEEACADKYGLDIVTVVPWLGAGGACATIAYKRFASPVMVDSIAAHAGLDIGDTFIGMHLKRVVVPVRGSIREIGSAHVTMARTRPRLIGGERARYTAEMAREFGYADYFLQPEGFPQ